MLVRRYGFDMAAVVSASHNPYEDNGIKFFGPEGMKIDDDQEAQIEESLEGGSARIGRVRELHGAPGDYLRELELRFRDLDLSGARILLDCANGATYRVAPEIFRRLGADVDAVAVDPDGRNINRDCGSTHVGLLAERMDGHDAGFAFDGDGDRVLAVDRNGAVVDGDELMALVALHLRAHERLPGDGVAVTVMTNYGFHSAMRDAGIAGGHHPGRRPPRARRAGPPWLGARRRAVGPHHRHGLRAGRRRHRSGAAGDGGSGRIGPRRARRDAETAPAAREREGSRPRGHRAGRDRLGGSRRAVETRSRAAAVCSSGPPEPSRSCA